jgi:hypothetical protein
LLLQYLLNWEKRKHCLQGSSCTDWNQNFGITVAVFFLNQSIKYFSKKGGKQSNFFLHFLRVAVLASIPHRFSHNSPNWRYFSPEALKVYMWRLAPQKGAQFGELILRRKKNRGFSPENLGSVAFWRFFAPKKKR